MGYLVGIEESELTAQQMADKKHYLTVTKQLGMNLVWAVRQRYKLPTWFILKKITEGCEHCRFKPDFMLDFHHLDENKKNNDMLNMAYLCPNCHLKLHRGKIDLVKLETMLHKKLRKVERDRVKTKNKLMSDYYD